MSKKFVLVTASLVIAATAVAAFVWKAQDVRARTELREAAILRGLSEHELENILRHQALTEPGAVEAIVASTDSRRAFLGGLREYLALAAQARREGLADEERFKINYEYKKKIMIADLYRAKLTAAQGNYYVVPQEEIAAVWSSPENENAFEKDMDALRSIQNETAKARGDQAVYGKLQGGSLEKARANWANAKVLWEKAIADPEFIGQPEIGLRLKILEAGILSADYLRKHWNESVKATPEEIANYLREHREYDPTLKRSRAEDALRRAVAGEDFAALAKEFSEDRSNRDKGGLYENVTRDDIWPQVVDALVSMKENQVRDQIVETDTGFHVLKLISKTNATDSVGSDQKFTYRHILLQKGFENPEHTNKEIPPPFVSSATIAKDAVEKAKRATFVASIVSKAEITLPEDFSVNLPAK